MPNPMSAGAVRFAPGRGPTGIPQAPTLESLRGTTYVISGRTLDAASAVLPSCTVKLFRTRDDLLVDQAVSDGLGGYAFSVSAAESYYVVAYLPGSPDVSGTTLNTLVGAGA